MSAVTPTRDETPSTQSTVPAARNDAALLPPVDVIEDATGITLYADMPGVPKDRVTLRVEDNQLSIEGEMQLALPEGMQPTHAEVQRARYRRAFTLSKELDADQVSAESLAEVSRVLEWIAYRSVLARP